MIQTGKTRKLIQDNNNYIQKYGKITHICNCCGNLYSQTVKLNIDCVISAPPCEREGYSVTTPNIEKVCDCGQKTMQIDNAMGLIAKTLVDKGYILKECCEGHAYIEDGVMACTYPYLKIEGNILKDIPTAYFNSLNIDTEIYDTVISGNCCQSCGGECPCQDLESYNKCKDEMLAQIMNLVKTLPKYQTACTTDSNPCSCRCNSCQ